MNANELADALEADYWDSRANKVMLEGAKMLRQFGLAESIIKQQQLEIEALKEALKIMCIDADSILKKAQNK